MRPLLKIHEELEAELKKKNPSIKRLRFIANKLSMEANNQLALQRTDRLTGLGNDLTLTELIDDLETRRSNVGIAYLDIQSLGLINNEYGRMYGDELIKKASDYLRVNKRTEDIVLRAGQAADEFIIITSNTTNDRERKFLERLVKVPEEYFLEIVLKNTIIKKPLEFYYGYAVNDGYVTLTETMKKAYEKLNIYKKRIKGQSSDKYL